MTTTRLFHVDSFATAPFAGNPAAVVLLDQEPAGDLGPRLGAELNKPATAVTWQAGEPGRFGLRWFTATSELALCGHGTLAAARVLLDAGLDADGRLRFDTRSGRLEARAEGDWVQLRFPSLRPGPPAAGRCGWPRMGTACCFPGQPSSCPRDRGAYPRRDPSCRCSELPGRPRGV